MIEQTCMQILEQCTYDTLSPDEQERMMTLLCHDIAVGAYASRSRWSEDIVRQQSSLIAADGPFTLFGRKEKSVSYDLAVQHNVMSVTMSVSEDFIEGTHPGAILFPVLIAEQERGEVSLKQMLDASAKGLKIAILLNTHLGQLLTGKGLRPPYVIGAMAAAAAVTWMRTQQIDLAMRAMSLAASSVGGHAFPFAAGTEEWLLEPVVAAQIAVMSSRNATSITFALEDFLSGLHSLGEWLGWNREARSDASLLDLTRIGVKKQPVNSFVQPVVEAILKLGPLDISRVERVTVQVPESFLQNKNLSRTGPLEKENLGILSIPVSGSLALRNQGLEYEDFKLANDAEIIQLSQKFTLEGQSDLQQFDVRVLIQTDGQVIQTETKTSEFYPSLDGELQWIKNTLAVHEQWMDRLTRFYQEAK